MKITTDIIKQHGIKPDEYKKIVSLIGRKPNFLEFAHPLKPIVIASYFDFISLIKLFFALIIGATITQGFLFNNPSDSALVWPIESFSGTPIERCKSFIFFTESW